MRSPKWAVISQMGTARRGGSSLSTIIGRVTQESKKKKIRDEKKNGIDSITRESRADRRERYFRLWVRDFGAGEGFYDYWGGIVNLLRAVIKIKEGREVWGNDLVLEWNGTNLEIFRFAFTWQSEVSRGRTKVEDQTVVFFFGE